MAFASTNAAHQANSVNGGPEIAEINTELIGFTALGQGSEGASKLQLLPTPWPNDNLPPASATLLSVASMRGLLAAASPDTLTISYTQNVRKAFQQKPGKKDIIGDFKPDLTISIQQPRHVAFSIDEEYLVVSLENGGNILVYSVDALLRGETKPERQIDTNESLRALLPNPNPDFAHYVAVVGDSGRLEIADISGGKKALIRSDGVTCASWSVKGRAYVIGLQDGTAAVFKTTDTELGTIPRPPELEGNYYVSSISYLGNDDFFLTHSPSPDNEGADPNDVKYHFVKTKFLKDETPKFKNFTFHKMGWDILYPHLEGDAPSRPPPTRLSVSRLRKWEPILEDMLILARADSSEIAVIANTSDQIAPDQDAFNEYQIVSLQDARRAQVPRQGLGEDIESAPIGEVLDLSGSEKVPRPAKRLLEVVEESPGPLPAYFVLTHEGLLAAWWVVWDKSLEAGTSFSGLTAVNKTARAAPEKITTDKPQPVSLFGPQSSGSVGPKTTSPFGQPAPSFGFPSAPTSGSSLFSSAPSAKPAQPVFGKPSQPAFGETSQPAFGKPTQPAFGKPSQPAFGEPSQPAFGKTTQPAFGSAAKMGVSPFGAPSSSSQAPSTQSKANPFAAFASGNSINASPLTSFESTISSPSPFGSMPQKSGFPGTSNSFGSTVNLTNSGTPSWANTPARQQSSIFGGTATSSFGSNPSGTEGVNGRERDEATPTPQAPPQSKGLFGLSSGEFKLKSTFTPDSTTKTDAEQPESSGGGSLFGNAFSSTLTDGSVKPPVTPQQEKTPIGFSTTPATHRKPSLEFPRGMSTSTPKSEEDVPPSAGSSPVQVEAPSSSVPSSAALDDDDREDEDGNEDEDDQEEGEEEESSDEDHTGDISVEEQEDEDGDQQTVFSPPDAARKARPSETGWSLQDSAHPSPRILPAAPTPPPASSQPFRPSFPSFGQPSKASPLSFGQPKAPGQGSLFGGSNKQAPSLPPGGRPKSALRNSSPVRPASTSAINLTRREPLPGSGSSLSASIQQDAQPEIPEPEVTDLVDDEDERIRQELASDIVPSRTLDPFIARQEYNGDALGKTGHAAQIEIVYRDINSMVDTLGLNSRSLEGFLQYHQQPHRESSLTLEELYKVNEEGEYGSWFEKWSLAELDDLIVLEDQLERQLDEGRVQAVIDKLTQLTRLLLDTGKLSTKINDVRRQIISRRDPEKLEVIRKASLPKELADHQKVLRAEYARLLTSLGQAEEAVMLLKSKLASYNAEHGKTGAVPTVDAIKKTISKLITITEKKNNDITLLEAQFRKVGLANSSRPTSSSSRVIGTPARRSRAGRGETPYATPPTNRSHVSLSKLNRTAMTPEVDETPTKGFGLFYTPEGSPSADKTLAKLGEMDDKDLARLREKARRRRNAAESLEDVLVRKGVRQTRV
ncbi:hypothetical protein DM02DRAFT_581602 [Periconia macrospinosa]|uniref:Nucleoporin Nup159/Nup146 N-terminal domain-containing protein n=1 Tax=Periconia macrospinosa TaxID=97972 RepID=A0A2V1EC64_9PLEO|nr:hypothetical protein DM02DRAFT_581602 [Periconia macrospinosa]